MDTTTHASGAADVRPSFYTVAETARLLRVDPATIYRAIREDAFPAVRVRARYVIPAAAVEQMAEQAARNRRLCGRGGYRGRTSDRPRCGPTGGPRLELVPPGRHVQHLQTHVLGRSW